MGSIDRYEPRTRHCGTPFSFNSNMWEKFKEKKRFGYHHSLHQTQDNTGKHLVNYLCISIQIDCI